MRLPLGPPWFGSSLQVLQLWEWHYWWLPVAKPPVPSQVDVSGLGLMSSLNGGQGSSLK